jgi:hypothetical protein
MAYYILAMREGHTWGIEFGDYDRETVQYELEDYRDGSQSIPAKNLRIIRCADARQTTINLAIVKLNEGTAQ